MSELSGENELPRVPNEEKEQSREYRGSKDILELSWPVLVLVQEQNPVHFKEVGKKEGRTYLNLDKPLQPRLLQDLSRVYYEPYLVAPRTTENDALNNYLNSDQVEDSGEFGPYKVYRIRNPEKQNDDTLAFGSRKKAAEKLGDIIPDGVPYSQPDIDRKPEVPETDEKHFVGVKRKERDEMREELEQLFDEKFMNRLKSTQNISEYPEQMHKGLRDIIKTIYDKTEKDAHGNVISNSKDPNWLQWRFAERHLLSLEQYLDYRLERDKKFPSKELANDLGEVLFDYDYVVETMKLQADMLIGEQKKPFHGAFLIPKGYIHGTSSSGVEVRYLGDNLVIQKGDETWEFPLPERNENGEVAIKGGVARLITKVVLGIPADDEIPPSDLDLVTFGKKDAFGMEKLRDTYGVEERDVERIKGDSIFEYMGDRDQSINEILFTENGLVLSMNALSAYFQRTTEASADPVRNIHGQHVLNVNRNYFDEFSDVADYFLINGARFPSPRALGRMYKFLIEGKTDSITVPEGSLKMDIGSVHWLVLARKLMSVPEKERRDDLLHRMVRLAGVVEAKQFREEYLDSKSGPYKFIEALAEDFESMSGRKFDMDSELSGKETLDWIASRFVRQVMTRFDRYYGYKKEESFSRRLTAKDMLPTQIVLPREEDLVYDESYKDDQKVETESTGVEAEEFNWREVNVEEILENKTYQELYKRHHERNQRMIEAQDWSKSDWESLMRRIYKEEDEDEKKYLKTSRERKEYLQWYIKFRTLEGIKSELDPGMYEILYQFNQLPLSSHQSDTGHIVPNTNRVEEDFIPVLSFLAYRDVTSEEKEIQLDFLRNITELNIRVCNKLGVVPYNIFDIRGDMVQSHDGTYKEISVLESIKYGVDIHMYLNLYGEQVETRGREVLTVAWEEFYKYVNSFLPEDKQEPLPDFDNGEIFVRRRKH